MKYPWQRVGVFIDVQNMYYSAKNLYQNLVNFSKILEEAVAGRQLIKAAAYVIRAEIPKQEQFFEALKYAGFDVKIKDLQVFAGGIKKGDWDVGIVMDILKVAPKLDVAVLVSGDGDFVELVDYLKSQGIRVEVMAFSQSASSKLKDVADEFIDLDKNPQKYLVKDFNKPKPRKKFFFGT